jgi:hypothetical protein
VLYIFCGLVGDMKNQITATRRFSVHAESMLKHFIGCDFFCQNNSIKICIYAYIQSLFLESCLLEKSAHKCITISPLELTVKKIIDQRESFIHLLSKIIKGSFEKSHLLAIGYSEEKTV